MILKEANRLNDKYKAVMLDLFDMQDDEERIIDEAKFQLDNLKYAYTVDEELEAEGYTEGQINRMKATAIRHLTAFVKKHDRS